MPRYFFDINDTRHTSDEEGLECADLQAAVQHAKRTLIQIFLDEIRKFGECRAQKILISDENDHLVYSGIMTYTVA